MTKTEVLDAIAFDFQQYGSQPLLFRKLAPLILGSRCRIIDHGENFSLWITHNQNNLLQKIDEKNLIFYFIHVLETTQYPLPVLADICALIFWTRACVGQTSEGNSDGIWIEHNMERFVCRQCGDCCRNLRYENDCTKEDYFRWQALGRLDILERVMVVQESGKPGRYRIWMDPATRILCRTCPWLAPHPQADKYLCLIQDIKPEICRQYPFTGKHAVMTGCKGEFNPSCSSSALFLNGLKNTAPKHYNRQ